MSSSEQAVMDQLYCQIAQLLKQLKMRRARFFHDDLGELELVVMGFRPWFILNGKVIHPHDGIKLMYKFEPNQLNTYRSNKLLNMAKQVIAKVIPFEVL